MTRRYAPHRRAYYPRVWPVAVPTALSAAGLGFVAGPTGAIWTAIVAGAFGAVVVSGRWAVWRRRHPVISAQEYVDDMRRAAPLN